MSRVGSRAAAARQFRLAIGAHFARLASTARHRSTGLGGGPPPLSQAAAPTLAAQRWQGAVTSSNRGPRSLDQPISACRKLRIVSTPTTWHSGSGHYFPRWASSWSATPEIIICLSHAKESSPTISLFSLPFPSNSCPPPNPLHLSTLPPSRSQCSRPCVLSAAGALPSGASLPSALPRPGPTCPRALLYVPLYFSWFEAIVLLKHPVCPLQRGSKCEYV